MSPLSVKIKGFFFSVVGFFVVVRGIWGVFVVGFFF